MTSQTDKVIEYLINKKRCKEVKSTSAKYRKFTDPKDANSFYWVGKNGALRSGRTVADSVSITDIFKKRIQNR